MGPFVFDAINHSKKLFSSNLSDLESNLIKNTVTLENLNLQRRGKIFQVCGSHFAKPEHFLLKWRQKTFCQVSGFDLEVS